MAHNLEIRDGKTSMAYAGVTPWHGLGEQMPEGAGVMEFFTKSRLNYTVQSVPVFSQPHPELPFDKAEGYRAIYRPDTKDTLGIVTDKYRPVQNSELAALAEVFHKDGRVIVESSGVLGKGERVWMLLKWHKETEIAGDKLTPYLLLSNGHDGKHSVEAKNTTVRVVCQNTLDIALGSLSQFKFSHIGDMQSKLKSVAHALGATEKSISLFSQLVEKFQKTVVTDVQALEFWDKLLPEADSERAKNIRKDIYASYFHAPGANPGTVWGLVNSVSFYTDHIMTTRGQDDSQRSSNKLKSIWYGAGQSLKTKAVSAAKQLVGV